MLVTIFKQLYHICLFILYKIIAQSLGRGVNSFFFNLGGGEKERAGFLKVTAYQRCSWSFMALQEFLYRRMKWASARVQ